MPDNWGYQAMDYRHLKSIHKMFGERELKDFPTINFFRRLFISPISGEW